MSRRGSSFPLWSRSQRELAGVHADLVRIVERAVELSAQPFLVLDGLRTRAEQEEILARGASTLIDSRHLSGHAVDLVPLVNGKPRWEWPAIHPIAEAMRAATIELGLPLRWGGAWDIDFAASTEAPEKLVEAYVSRRRKARLRAMIDGPHYELPRGLYPA